MKKKLPNFLLSASIGDICGVPYEFKHKKDPIIIPHPEADYSDDTVCTFGIAKAFLEGCEDISGLLRGVCRIEEGRGYGKLFRKWIKDDNMGPYGSFGNGSAMRVSGIPYLASTTEECMDWAIKSAEITHNHPEGIKGALSVALGIYKLLSGEDKNEVGRYILGRFYPDYQYKDYHEIPLGEFDSSCQGSIPPVFLALLEAQSYTDALRLVYSLRADTDTQGAIIGPLAYAYFEEMPEDLVNLAKSKLPGWMLEVNEEFNLWPSNS